MAKIHTLLLAVCSSIGAESHTREIADALKQNLAKLSKEPRHLHEHYGQILSNVLNITSLLPPKGDHIWDTYTPVIPVHTLNRLSAVSMNLKDHIERMWARHETKDPAVLSQLVADGSHEAANVLSELLQVQAENVTSRWTGADIGWPTESVVKEHYLRPLVSLKLSAAPFGLTFTIRASLRLSLLNGEWRKINPANTMLDIWLGWDRANGDYTIFGPMVKSYLYPAFKVKEVQGEAAFGLNLGNRTCGTNCKERFSFDSVKLSLSMQNDGPGVGDGHFWMGPTFKWAWNWAKLIREPQWGKVTRSYPFWIESEIAPFASMPWVYIEMGFGQWKPIQELGSYVEPFIAFPTKIMPVQPQY